MGEVQGGGGGGRNGRTTDPDEDIEAIRAARRIAIPTQRPNPTTSQVDPYQDIESLRRSQSIVIPTQRPNPTVSQVDPYQDMSPLDGTINSYSHSKTNNYPGVVALT